MKRRVDVERGDKPEKGGVDVGMRGGGVATFLLLYCSITFTVCVGESKVPFILDLQSFELTIQDSHPCLFCTKT